MNKHVICKFEAISIKTFNVNDCPYYILNLNENIKQISKVQKSDIVFTNLYSHFSHTNSKNNNETTNNISKNNNELLIELLTSEFSSTIREQSGRDAGGNGFKYKINIIDNSHRYDLLDYIDVFINDTYNFIEKFNNYEVIEVPLFFIKSFYCKLNNSNFLIFKSKYFNKYIDCYYILKYDSSSSNSKTNAADIIHIDSLYAFEELFNDNKTDLINYINKISEAAEYVYVNNFYGVKSNNYFKLIEEFRGTQSALKPGARGTQSALKSGAREQH